VTYDNGTKTGTLDVSGGGGLGTGEIAVDHDTGGTDNLRLVDPNGTGIGGAEIRAYLKADYDAGTLDLKDEAVTLTSGRWSTPMYLDAGTYTFVFAKPGIIRTVIKEQAVS
jgi:hypothetical protein